MLRGATGVACTGVKLTYDTSVVAVTGATEGDFTTFFGFDDEHAADGWVTISTAGELRRPSGSVHHQQRICC